MPASSDHHGLKSRPRVTFRGFGPAVAVAAANLNYVSYEPADMSQKGPCLGPRDDESGHETLGLGGTHQK